MATKKQRELLASMLKELDTEFDWCGIEKSANLSNGQCSILISNNYDLFKSVIDDGQCSPRQYNILKQIAGRQLRKERCEISFSQATEWIKKYKNRNSGKKISKKEVTESEVKKNLDSEKMLKNILSVLGEDYKEYINSFLNDLYDFYSNKGFLSYGQLQVLRRMFLVDLSVVVKVLNGKEFDENLKIESAEIFHEEY